MRRYRCQWELTWSMKMNEKHKNWSPLWTSPIRANPVGFFSQTQINCVRKKRKRDNLIYSRRFLKTKPLHRRLALVFLLFWCLSFLNSANQSQTILVKNSICTHKDTHLQFPMHFETIRIYTLYWIKSFLHWIFDDVNDGQRNLFCAMSYPHGDNLCIESLYASVHSSLWLWPRPIRAPCRRTAAELIECMSASCICIIYSELLSWALALALAKVKQICNYSLMIWSSCKSACCKQNPINTISVSPIKTFRLGTCFSTRSVHRFYNLAFSGLILNCH